MLMLGSTPSVSMSPTPQQIADLRLDVHFISSLPVMPRTAYKAWVDSKPVQMVWGVD